MKENRRSGWWKRVYLLVFVLGIREITTTIGKWKNYNDWEKIVIKTTTIGIPIVGVNYNGWEMSRW